MQKARLMTAGLKLCKKQKRKSGLSRPGTLKISKLFKMSNLNLKESPIRYQNSGPLALSYTNP